MALSTLAIVGIIEACLMTVIVILAMAYYIVHLKRRLKKVLALHPAAGSSPGSITAVDPIDQLVGQRDVMPSPLTQKTYATYIDQQLLILREHHGGLAGGRDISLDIDPATPLERRVAAVRYAVLVAEREAIQPEAIDWAALITRYKALLSYCDDFLSAKAQTQIGELTQALNLAKQQVVATAKYRDLYFDLEATWSESKTQASDYHQQINDHLAQPGVQNADELIELVGQYHRSYDNIKLIFDSQEPLPLTIEAASEELRELRRTTSEQYQVIEKLKRQISSATDDNAKVSLIRGLEDELNRQQRFIKESESCVKLLEDELTSVHKEMQSIKAKVKEIPRMRAYIKELEDDAGVGDVVVNRQKDEIRALKAELSALTLGNGRSNSSAEPDPSGELLTEIKTLKKQYAELEERYLDLKLGG